MRTLATIICLCIMAYCAKAQHRFNPDSLKLVLEHASGKEKVEILRNLSLVYLGADKDKSIFYAEESLNEAEKLGNDTFIVRSLNNLAAAYQNLGERRKSMPLLDRAVSISRANGNKVQLLEAIEFRATAYAAMKQTDKALSEARESLALSEELKDSVGILNGSEIIAAAYKDLGQTEEAVKIYKQELSLLEYLPQRLFEKGRACVNLGEVYALMNRETEAIPLFIKGREYFDQLGYPAGVLAANLDLADTYLNNRQIAEAEKTFREIIDMNQSIGDPELTAKSYAGLGKIAMQRRQLGVAQSHFEQAEAAAKPAALFVDLREIYSDLNDLHCLKGDYENAGVYKQLSKNYADSLFSADVLDRMSDYQVQYETLQKEKALAEQSLQITAQKAEIFKSNTLNYGLMLSILVLGILAYLFYNRFRLRKEAELSVAIIHQQKLGLNAVIEAQEAERKRIARDLHDGIAQELVALKLGFSTLGHKISKLAPAEAGNIEELNKQLDSSCTEVRSIAHVMMPPRLAQHGLPASLELLLHNTLDRPGIEYSFTATGMQQRFEEKVEVGLYRIVQELLNNISKHSQATKVGLELFVSGSTLFMKMEDNGVGFDFESAKSKGSMGLLNLVSRVDALGGTLLTEKALPKGIKSTIGIPI
ncbi:MAG: sensor histidine kinase [Lewinellaceae bacterium]|nr:sensor histidine kinase [Lewinellaceae bacterium]